MNLVLDTAAEISQKGHDSSTLHVPRLTIKTIKKEHYSEQEVTQQNNVLNTNITIASLSRVFSACRSSLGRNKVMTLISSLQN